MNSPWEVSEGTVCGPMPVHSYFYRFYEIRHPMAADGILSRLDPDLILQEALYGFINVLIILTTAQAGFVTYSSRTAMIWAIIAVDFVWGAIDMYIYYRFDLLARDRRIHTYNNEFVPVDRESRIKVAESEFDGTMFELATEEDRRRMAEIFVDSNRRNSDSIKKVRPHYLTNAVTAFIVSMLTTIPAVLCLSFIEDFVIAAFCASVTSAVAMFFLGYKLAPGDSVKTKFLTGLTMAMVALVMAVFAVLFDA